MAKRGRPAGFVMSQEHRTKIANSKIFKHLMEHAEGKRDMSSTQVQVGLSMMDRIMPKLSNVQISGDEDAPVKHVHEVQLTALKPDES